MESKNKARIILVWFLIGAVYAGVRLGSTLLEKPHVTIWIAEDEEDENYAVGDWIEIKVEVTASSPDATVTVMYYPPDGKEHYVVNRMHVYPNVTNVFHTHVEPPAGEHNLEIYATVVVNEEEMTLNDTCSFSVSEY